MFIVYIYTYIELVNVHIVISFINVYCEITADPTVLQILLTKTSAHRDFFENKIVQWFIDSLILQTIRYKPTTIHFIEMIHIVSLTRVLILFFFFLFSIFFASQFRNGMNHVIGHRENLVEEAFSTETDPSNAR